MTNDMHRDTHVERDRPAHGIKFPPEPRSPAEAAAVAAFERVLLDWFHGGGAGWVELTVSERWLIARDLMQALRSARLEVRPKETSNRSGVAPTAARSPRSHARGKA